MGYVTNDPKKGDEQQPGGSGLVVDLGLMACPQCRREVPDWSDVCPECGVQAVPKTSMGAVMPDIPAHLLGDDDADPADPDDHSAAPDTAPDTDDAPDGDPHAGARSDEDED